MKNLVGWIFWFLYLVWFMAMVYNFQNPWLYESIFWFFNWCDKEFISIRTYKLSIRIRRDKSNGFIICFCTWCDKWFTSIRTHQIIKSKVNKSDGVIFFFIMFILFSVHFGHPYSSKRLKWDVLMNYSQNPTVSILRAALCRLCCDLLWLQPTKVKAQVGLSTRTRHTLYSMAYIVHAHRLQPRAINGLYISELIWFMYHMFSMIFPYVHMWTVK